MKDFGMRREDEREEEFYLAGERVPPGMYKHVDSPYILKLDGEASLPARLDGRVTYYVRIHAWGDALPSDPQMFLSPVNGLGSEDGRAAGAGRRVKTRAYITSRPDFMA